MRTTFIELAGRTGELNPGTERTAELLSRACDLLCSLLPELAPQVIRHVTALGMVTAEGQDGLMLSAAGGAPLPGLIMIRPGQLERPWDAAASPNLGYQRPEQRLRYLAEQLTGPLADDLTLAGRRFVTWQLDAIAPLTGWPIGPASQARTAAKEAHPATGYERVLGIAARLDPQTRSGLIFNQGSGLLHVVNLTGWVAFSLCDGRELAALRHSYGDITASKPSTADAAGS